MADSARTFGKIQKLRARRSNQSHILWIEDRDYYILMNPNNIDERNKHMFALALAAQLNDRSVEIEYTTNEQGLRVVDHIQLVS